MLSYHNTPELKAHFIQLLEWHWEQDKIVQGTYWDGDEEYDEYIVNGYTFASGGYGCAVGCSIESLRIITGRIDLSHQDHALYEELIGVPQVLARLEDGIFEGLPTDESHEWPIQFAQAIPIGVDLSLVWPRFAVWLLGDKDDGVIRFAKTDRQRTAIQNVVDAYLRLLEGNPPTKDEWRSLAADAYAAAADAYAAAYAADADAAAAADAYAAAAAAAYAAAAKTQARQKQAAKLLELIATIS